ncbi:ABC transporter ATP-binding protein [Maledivibacter halophilus]|uniref:Nickel import system ATP-binding protein NikD n=1 Tax=Maledivibacter halophilus TaxID=36842 RepID=A0A1T5M0P2_9FIRM|nr:ABC transporter ATP-binding protein [Maledivibacter halophilus]SKC81449.1 peptide/nickel transport system ATP-binding protein [Maledivibacter halophilus]
MKENIKIESLNIYFKTKAGNVKAVDNVSLELEKGKVIGLIGETGSGKSVLGLSILRLLAGNAVVSGSIIYKDIDILNLNKTNIVGIRGKEIALVPQNPGTALNPIIKVGKQIAEGIILHEKAKRKEAKTKTLAIIKRLMMDSSISKAYPFELSGGMKQRVLAAIGISSDPTWLIADEPTKGLDAIVRNQVYKTFNKIKKRKDTGILLITHDLILAEKLCDKIAVMYAGDILEFGLSKEVLENPKHPYTKGLVNSQPHMNLKPMKGLSPSLINLPKGCKFHPRCGYAMKKCFLEKPLLYKTPSGSKVRCFLFDKTRKYYKDI